MTLTELKAHAYDCLANIEIWQKELEATNKLIKEEANKPKEEPKEEPKKK